MTTQHTTKALLVLVNSALLQYSTSAKEASFLSQEDRFYWACNYGQLQAHQRVLSQCLSDGAPLRILEYISETTVSYTLELPSLLAKASEKQIPRKDNGDEQV